jgi:segregation and condensation protein B
MTEQEDESGQDPEQDEPGMADAATDEGAGTEPVGRIPLESDKLRQILEGLLMAAGKPLSLDAMQALFEDHERPEKDELRAALTQIEQDCDGRGYLLKEVGSGFRFQVRESLSGWVSRLWDEKPQRYTRAMLETLALIAYRQPITRGDIEEIRGVGVSSTIIRTLLDREWVRVVGHRDVPGRPAMFATTRQFLDYFDLKSLQDLPPLSEIRDLDQLNGELELDDQPVDSRVLDLPDEEDETAGPGRDEEEGDENAEGEDRPSWSEDELPDEEEAMALARRPLDDILSNPDLDENAGTGSESDETSGREAGEDDEDDEEQR